MPQSDIPCLSLAIERLANAGKDNFAVWVVQAPYPGGYVKHDCVLSAKLVQAWQAWQAMFAPHASPLASPDIISQALAQVPEVVPFSGGKINGQGGRLMQHLCISLWQWIFQGQVQMSLEKSQGIAIGQGKPLRLRIDIREPDLIALPWEIMQPQAGKPAISLPSPLQSPQVFFSRTTSDVGPLISLPPSQGLSILLVLGQDTAAGKLQLEAEARILEQTLRSFQQLKPIDRKNLATVPCRVDTLLQPTPKELISQLETQTYNIFFYSGHGLSAPNGGLLFLSPGVAIDGTELAHVLARSQVKLCAINACWGAQPAFENGQPLPRSSLAEVLIHHGVPAVLGMRDEIADEEALSFIQVFTQALAAGSPIDRAAAIARQQLLALYKFISPAWTLPILYMHPEFDGELLGAPDRDEITQLPEDTIAPRPPVRAQLRSVSPPEQVWHLGARLVRVGRLAENDVVIQESWVSQRHAEIYCRQDREDTTFFLRDNSRFGTFLSNLPSSDRWQNVYREEVPLKSGMKLKFGSHKGQTFEFIVED
jgi:CHAT domain/FHA domain